MYNELRITSAQSILIVAPHPDDETIGCGGLLSLFGSQCDVLLLTDGRKGVPADGSKTEEETAVIRKREFEAVMQKFRVNSFRALDIPDSSLNNHKAAAETVDLRSYDLVFVPNRNERHPDHKAAFEIIHALLKKQKAKAQLLEYEVWSPLIEPNRFLDISEVMVTKLQGLREYVSQTVELDYELLVKGLNVYRGAPRHVAYCEAFFAEETGQWGWKHCLAARLPQWVRRFAYRLLR